MLGQNPKEQLQSKDRVEEEINGDDAVRSQDVRVFEARLVVITGDGVPHGQIRSDAHEDRICHDDRDDPKSERPTLYEVFHTAERQATRIHDVLVDCGRPFKKLRRGPNDPTLFDRRFLEEFLGVSVRGLDALRGVVLNGALVLEHRGPTVSSKPAGELFQQTFLSRGGLASWIVECCRDL